MKCLRAIHVDRNQQTFLEQMTSFVARYDVIYHSLPIISQYLMMWGGGGQPWPCDLQMTAYKKGLLMHDVVQLTCLAANDILLMQKWNHAFFLLGIAHAWKWQIALLPKEILIKKQNSVIACVLQISVLQINYFCAPHWNIRIFFDYQVQ